MTASALPLPLELAQPIPLSGDLDTTFRAGLHIGRYDPKTQMNFGTSACDDTSSESEAESNTSDNTGLIVIDSQTDFAVADDFLQDFDNGGGSFTDTSSESSAESNTTDNTGLIVIDSQTDAAVLDDFLQDFGNA